MLPERLIKQLYFGTLHYFNKLVLYCYYREKNTDFFQSTCVKERSNVAVTKTLEQRNIFVKNNVFQLSHGVKTFIKASSTDTLHTGEKVFLQLSFLKPWRSFFQSE